MAFELPQLPYSLDALSPHISKETLEFHHGKHHQAYVTKTNELIQGKDYEKMSLEEIIKKSEGVLFNNAAQVWNHSFFWNCLSPQGGGKPTGPIGERIDQTFGSFDKFKEEFSQAAITQFGSGWAWLSLDKNGKIQIQKTPNAENPMTQGQKPLLTLDVWEHAYYIDYRNARPKFVEAFWNLVNWDFVNKNLS